MTVVDGYIHQIEKYSQVVLDLCLSGDFIYNLFLIHEIDAGHKLVVGNYFRAVVSMGVGQLEVTSRSRDVNKDDGGVNDLHTPNLLIISNL